MANTYSAKFKKPKSLISFRVNKEFSKRLESIALDAEAPPGMEVSLADVCKALVEQGIRQLGGRCWDRTKNLTEIQRQIMTKAGYEPIKEDLHWDNAETRFHAILVDTPEDAIESHIRGFTVCYWEPHRIASAPALIVRNSAGIKRKYSAD